MRSSRRWLFAFGLAIVGLVIVVVVLVLTTASPADKPLLAEDTPEGTVQRFLLAVSDQDYLAAESYLSPTIDEDKIDYDLWRDRVAAFGEDSAWQATLGESIIRDDEATVDVTVAVFRPRGPFDNSVRTHQVTFFLQKEGTSWRITSPVNLWWLY